MVYWVKHPFPSPATDLKHGGKGQVCTGLVFRSEVVRRFSACRRPLNLHRGRHPTGNKRSRKTARVAPGMTGGLFLLLGLFINSIYHSIYA